MSQNSPQQTHPCPAYHLCQCHWAPKPITFIQIKSDQFCQLNQYYLFTELITHGLLLIHFQVRQFSYFLNFISPYKRPQYFQAKAQQRSLVVMPKNAPLCKKQGRSCIIKACICTHYKPAQHHARLTLPRTSTGSLELRSTGLTLSPVSMPPTGERLSKMASNFSFSSAYMSHTTHKHS